MGMYVAFITPADTHVQTQADFTVGSRNVGGGEVKDWPLHRKIISAVATYLAVPLVPQCTDPMSGFFCLSKDTFVRGLPSLNPMGYKIGLELMVRCGCKRVQEIPIVFRDREAGESKLTMKQNLLYLRQLAGLYWGVHPIPSLLLIVALLALAYFFML